MRCMSRLVVKTSLLLLLIFAFWSASAKTPPRFEPVTEVPGRAAWVDLAGDGATTGRGFSGAAVFTPNSMEALDYERGRIRIDSTAQTLALSEPATELLVQAKGGRAGTVVEITALAGDFATGSLLFALDGKPREGVLMAVDGRMGIKTREPFTRVELRVVHAPRGQADVRIESAWVVDAARGFSANDAALACQIPLGLLYNAAFGVALVPSPVSGIAQGTAYAANLGLKFCLPFFEEPASRERRVPAGTCEATFRQDHMVSKVENVLGVSLGYNNNWGELGSPFVYHHNTELDVMMLIGDGTPPVAPRLDLEYWYNTANFEPTDRIWAECDDEDGSVAFSQVDGTGPRYRCPYEEGRELSFPVGQTPIRWRVNARMSPLDYFPGVPGLPAGAKGQPWSGLILNIITEGLLVGSDIIFSGWRTDNFRDRFQFVTVFDEIPPTVIEQPFSDNRITATLVGPPGNQQIHVTIEADEAGGVSALRYAPLLRQMYQVQDACDRSTSMSPTYPTEALKTFWPVSTVANPAAFDITWTARDPGPNLAFERNETPVTMRVEVVDTQPPVIVSPDDIVEVDTGTVSELGQPLVFDFVDLNPVVTNNAVLPIGFGLTFVTWTVTDASGNSDTATQIVNVKNSNLDPSPIAQTGANRVDAVSFEPTPIRLTATDPDGDPLRFFIDDAPDEGFFIAPLYPYFVEDFRIEQSISDAELETLCGPNGSGDPFNLNFPSQPEFLSVTDDGRTYVVDQGYIFCTPFFPNGFERRSRIAVIGNDGTLVNARQQFDSRDVVVDANREQIVSTAVFFITDAGATELRVYDLDLELRVEYRLGDIQAREDGSCPDLSDFGCTLLAGRSAVIDDNQLIYVMDVDGEIVVLDGTLPPGFDCAVNCRHTPTFISILNGDDVIPFSRDATGLALDGQGQLYAGRRGRLFRYSASYIADDGLAYPGELQGWLGRCDIDLAPGDQAVCDVGNHRSLGFSCTDDTCAVDEAFNNDERVTCGGGIVDQAIAGRCPGQFSGTPAVDLAPDNTVYVADTGNARVQRFSTDGFFAGQAESTCDGSCFVLGDFGNPENITVNSSRFYIIDPDTNLLHISLLTPFIEIGPDYADLEYQSRNQFACNNPDDCIDAFSFSVSDGVRDPTTGRPIRSAPAAVEVGVVRNFRPPFATPGIAVLLDEDTPIAVTLDGSDPDPLDSLSFAVAVPPEFGSVQIVNNQATYTPNPDFYGSDAFSFTVSDGNETSAPEAVTVTVAEINDAPEVQLPGDDSAGVGFVYRLSTDFIDPDPNEQHLLVVDWGDGTVELETGVDGGGPELGQSGDGPGTINAQHIYTAAGTFIAEFCLTDRVTGEDGSEVPTAHSLTGCNSVPITVIDGLDLVLSAQPSSERALPNQLVNVVFSVLNDPPDAGPASSATGVELVVELPDGLAPGSITVSGSGCSLDAQTSPPTVVCSIGTLAAGSASDADITAQVDGSTAPGTLLTFVASASMNQTDVNPDNELAHVISVAPPADLYVDAFGEEAFMDKPDINPGDGACASEDGVCTLRAAIEEANAQPGLRTVALGTGVYSLDDGNAIDITDDLVLVGSGAARSIIDGTNGNTALSVNDASVLLRVEDLTLSRGRIRAFPGDLVIRRSRLTGGFVDGFVGGAILANNLIDIRDTIIDGNRAVSGGAVWAQGASSGVFENVTITGNQGGGLYLGGSNYTLNHVTITGNLGDTGGASGVSGGALTVRNGADVTITGSVLADNYRPPGLLDVPVNCAIEAPGTITSGGDNLFGDLTGCGFTPEPSDVLIDDADTRFQPLRVSELPLPFVAPRADSPAIDAMLGPNCPPADAVGTARPVDGNNDGFADCDIGAIELVPELSPPFASLSAFSLNFGDVEPGNSSSVQSLQISNTGQQTLQIQAINLIGNDADGFEIMSDGCGNQSLVETASCTIELRFSPANGGVKTAQLQIRSNDPESIKTVELRGSSDVIFADGFEAME